MDILIFVSSLQSPGLHFVFWWVSYSQFNHLITARTCKEEYMFTRVSGGRVSGDGPATHPVPHQGCAVLWSVGPGRCFVSVGAVSRLIQSCSLGLCDLQTSESSEMTFYDPELSGGKNGRVTGDDPVIYSGHLL